MPNPNINRRVVLIQSNIVPTPPIAGWVMYHNQLGLSAGQNNRYGITDATNAIQTLKDPTLISSTYNEQLTGLVQPLLSANQFGAKPSIGFGSGRFMNTSNLTMSQNVSGLTFYCVSKVTSGGASRVVFFMSVGTSASNARFVVSSSAANVWSMSARRLDADGAATLTAGSTLTDKVLAFVVDYANSNAYIYENGVLINSSTSFLTDGATSNTASLASFFGKNNTGNEFAGNVGTPILYNTAHDATQVLQISTWLNTTYSIY